MDYWWNGIALYHSSGKCEHLWHQTSIFLIRIDSTFHHSAYLSTTLNICLPWYHHHFASSQRFPSVRNVNIRRCKSSEQRDTEETWHGCSKSPIDSSISDKNVVLKIVPKYLKIISTNVTGRDQVNFSIPLSLLFPSLFSSRRPETRIAYTQGRKEIDVRGRVGFWRSFFTDRRFDKICFVSSFSFSAVEQEMRLSNKVTAPLLLFKLYSSCLQIKMKQLSNERRKRNYSKEDLYILFCNSWRTIWFTAVLTTRSGAHVAQ